MALKNQFFLLLHTDCISLALPLSLLPFTRDAHMICLQSNVSKCVKIWIFNISNTDSFTQTIYLWYKYLIYSKWICVSFSFQYILETRSSMWRIEEIRWKVQVIWVNCTFLFVHDIDHPIAVVQWFVEAQLPTSILKSN